MSATQCPACETVFRVVPDQLKLYDGWVRCGQCQNAFQATAHLVTQPAAMVEVRAEPEEETKPASLPPQTDNAIETADTLPEPAEVNELLAVSSGDEAANLHTHTPLPAEDAAEEPELNAEADADTPLGFVQQAERRAAWRSPAVRILLALTAVLLTLALALQVVLFERDRIATFWPQTHPWLEKFCALWGCSIQPLRQIDALQLESSSFAPAGSTQYRLSFVIRNTAAWPVATPALELKLTNMQDQAVIQRVMRAHDMPNAPRSIAAGAEWSQNLTLALNEPSTEVVGYKVAFFYP